MLGDIALLKGFLNSCTIGYSGYLANAIHDALISRGKLRIERE